MVAGDVVVDSTGLLVVAVGVGLRLAVGFFVAVGLAAGAEVIRVDSRRGTRSRGAVCRGSASVTNSAVGVWLGVGAGVGLGRPGALASAAGGSSPGSGSTALERTGPPARLTLMRPP